MPSADLGWGGPAQLVDLGDHHALRASGPADEDLEIEIWDLLSIQGGDGLWGDLGDPAEERLRETLEAVEALLEEDDLEPLAKRALHRAAEALLEVLSGDEEQLGANLASKAREILGRLAEVLGDEPLAERIRSFAAQEEPSPGALEA